MTKPAQALCDQCGKITDVDFKEQSHPNNIKEAYFKCEHCFYHYTSFVMDGKVRKLQRIRDDLKGLHNADRRLEIQQQINERMNLLKYNLINFGRADL